MPWWPDTPCVLRFTPLGLNDNGGWQGTDRVLWRMEAFDLTTRELRFEDVARLWKFCMEGLITLEEAAEFNKLAREKFGLDPGGIECWLAHKQRRRAEPPRMRIAEIESGNEPDTAAEPEAGGEHRQAVAAARQRVGDQT